MVALMHYGVKGMKWKDHKLATYDPVQAHKTAIETKPGQQLVVKKPYDPVSVHERMMAVKAMPKTGSVVKKKRKRRKVKDVFSSNKTERTEGYFIDVYFDEQTDFRCGNT